MSKTLKKSHNAAYEPEKILAVDRREFLDRLKTTGALALAAAIEGGVIGTLLDTRSAEAHSGVAVKRKFRYGMVIDTRRCVGCKSCVVACKAENKTPPGVSYNVVLEGLFGEQPDDRPVFATKPCFHCEKPPCVSVCPSARHSSGNGTASS